MEHARAPAELILEGGPACRADTWRKWLRQFQIFLKASGVHKEPKDVQASLLINLIGPEGYDIYSTLKFTSDSDRDDIDKVISAFNGYFGSKPNIIMVRFKFFTRIQEPGESIDEYVTALKLLSQQCDFQQLEDSLVRDKIVCGVADSTLRDRLLRADDLTLERAVKICQANEVTLDENRQIEDVKTEVKSGTVNALQRSGGGYLYGARSFTNGRGRSIPRVSRGRGAGGGERGTRAASSWVSGAASGSGARAPAAAARDSAVCRACGSAHCIGGNRCAAKNVKCFVCGFKGHFRLMCPTNRKNKVFEINEDSDSDSEPCEVPAKDVVPNGKVKVDGYDEDNQPAPGTKIANFTLTIKCDDDYVPWGLDNIWCGGNRWDPYPECVVLSEVPQLKGLVENGKVRALDEFGNELNEPGVKTFMFTLEVQCDPGYILAGVKEIRCKNNELDHPIPECVKPCKVPLKDEVKNGVTSCKGLNGTNDLEPGSDVPYFNMTITCNEDFILTGANTIICNRSHWDNNISECVAPCNVPPMDQVENGYITYSNFSGTNYPKPGRDIEYFTMTISCNESYVLIGDNTRTCNRSEGNNKIYPECVKGCEVPPKDKVKNGSLTYQSSSGKGDPQPATTIEHFTVNVTCYTGYVLIGNDTITCNRSILNSTYPECVGACKVPSEIENGDILILEFSSAEYPDPGSDIEYFTMTVNCTTGYSLRGIDTVACNRSIWDDKLPECVKSCVVPPLDKVKNGIFKVEGYDDNYQPAVGTELSDITLNIKCNTGYTIWGHHTVNCSGNTWDHYSECVEPCEVPAADVVPNGRVKVDGYDEDKQPPPGTKIVNFTLSIICDDNYVPWGFDNIRCGGNNWDPYPECVVLSEVPQLKGLVKNGKVRALDEFGNELMPGAKTFMFTLEVQCDPGYILMGIRVIRCKNNVLDYPIPECVKSCPTTTTTSTTTTVRTTMAFDVEKFLMVVANLTYDYYTNLTQQLNMTLQKLSPPTCPPTWDPPATEPDYSVFNESLRAKCFVCGLNTSTVPWDADCSDAFAGDFLSLMPRNQRAKSQLGNYRKYCIYKDINNYYLNDSMSRMMFGRWTGGCVVRWADVSGIYTERTCRSLYRPIVGNSYASKRMAKLEMTLQNVENGCVSSPTSSLLPLSRSVSLFSRFHVCVCSGNWCNAAPASLAAMFTITFCVILTFTVKIATQ